MDSLGIRSKSHQAGFTLIEILIAITILAVISSIALVGYRGYIETTRINIAINQLTEMSIAINDFGLDNARFPTTLDVIGLDNMQDPWGNPYQYLNIVADPGHGGVRKDHNLVPLNTDYDLYSMGPDGNSFPPLTAKASRDDIIRANNGGYIGPAADY
jgi:general secretion pathway protein G